MMTRRQIRETAFRVLFALNFCPKQHMQEQLDFYYSGRKEIAIDELIEPEDEKAKIKIDDQAWPEVCSKCLGAAEHLEEIDEAIDMAAEGWKLTRLTKVDLTILRLAIYEIRFEKLEQKIAINEAVELAKAYGTDKSPSFVNGVLAKIL